MGTLWCAGGLGSLGSGNSEFDQAPDRCARRAIRLLLAPFITDSVPAVTPTSRSVIALIYLSAIALAAVSAGFSITGLTAVFVGSFWPVIAMGVALELGKLSAVTWLGRHGARSPLSLRAALAALVAVLMGLNAVGAYGFLARAHIGHQTAGELLTAGRGVAIDARINVQTGVVADLDRRIAQIDKAVETATLHGRTAAAMHLATEQRRNRAELAAQRVSEAGTLSNLQVERAAVAGERQLVEADLGPVRYLATLIGAGDQDVLRWFILVISCLLDPAAVLLLYAASKPAPAGADRNRIQCRR